MCFFAYFKAKRAPPFYGIKTEAFAFSQTAIKGISKVLCISENLTYEPDIIFCHMLTCQALSLCTHGMDRGKQYRTCSACSKVGKLFICSLIWSIVFNDEWCDLQVFPLCRISFELLHRRLTGSQVHGLSVKLEPGRWLLNLSWITT